MKSEIMRISKSDNIKIENGDDFYTIKIAKSFISKSTRTDVIDLVRLATSPLFLDVPKDRQFFKMKTVERNEVIGKVVIFMEMTPHITGGRYSIIHQAVLLAELFEVHLIVDRETKIHESFKDYKGYKNFVITIDSTWLTNVNNNEFDFVIGVPNISAQYAYEYSRRHHIPFFCYMFESPNYVSMYRDGIDSQDEFWEYFKKVISKADLRISPSNVSSKYLKEWLGINNNTFKVVYPCMNLLVASSVKNSFDKDDKYSDDIIMITRVTKFKNPIGIFKVLDRMGYKKTIHIVGKILDNIIGFDSFQNLKVILHNNVSDKYKFELLRDCKFMIFPSKFEGFGMPPMEALYFGKPVIAYKLPTLEEAYGDSIEYVELGDEKKFAMKILEVDKNIDDYVGKIKIPNHIYPEVCRDSLINSIKSFNCTTITAGVLAFNCIDYIGYVIESIYDSVDKIIIAEGCVKGMEKYADVSYHSSDGTFDFITDVNKLIDPDKKIEIIARSGDRPWNNKIEMQNEIAKRVRTNLYVKVDADEIWDANVLRKIVNYMTVNRDIDIVRMKFIHFWTNFSTIAVDAGGKWSTCHPRVWRWKTSFRHSNSFNYFVDTKNDNRKVCEPFYKEIVWESDEPIYHFGYARKSKYIRQKLNYYKDRGIEKIVLVNIYDDWNNIDDRTQPTQNVRSWAVKFNKEVLPDVVKNHRYYNVDDIRREQDD